MHYQNQSNWEALTQQAMCQEALAAYCTEEQKKKLLESALYCYRKAMLQLNWHADAKLYQPLINDLNIHRARVAIMYKKL